ncbi:hypothetical protein COLO4_16645 [Corchorus olitorius]|uniref:Secreted protein n=1 Tax=Corchorus olitorius TaxID=93759 RepID=A0A1R3JG89_9ROSI|nr:hypothetical protein COLO4_16645 [Corchorus olitorius]
MGTGRMQRIMQGQLLRVLFVVTVFGQYHQPFARSSGSIHPSACTSGLLQVIDRGRMLMITQDFCFRFDLWRQYLNNTNSHVADLQDRSTHLHVLRE